jgi:hypothetical protein
MNARPTIVKWVSVGLLAGGTFLTLVAWRVQESAHSDLSRARSIQGREVPDSASKPPDLEQYRAVLDTLGRSIRIRTEIDGRLEKVESIVRALDSRRRDSEQIANAGRAQLTAIAGLLGGASGGAQRSVRGLRGLGDGIAASARLSRLIAEELEELDRNLGPTLRLPDLGDLP